MAKSGDKEMAKKVALVFPGISRVYTHREIAARHFYDFSADKQETPSGSNRFMVLFKVKLDGEVNSYTNPPMSVKKALGDDKLGIQCHANNKDQ